jgi:hypothetical protein
MNPVTGEKIVTIGGESLTMRFTWKALAEISAKYGDNPNLFEPETVAYVGSAGLREHHPEMTQEKIMQLSPPLIPFAKDVQTALQWAYFGTEAIPDDEPTEKKSRKTAGLWARFVRLFRPA